MKNEDMPAELDAFEQESQRLLLDISLQNSALELHGIVNQSPKHSLPTYYKELEEWRTPVVMPSRASMVTVKGVPKWQVLFCTIG